MRERWFGATGRRVPEIAVEGDPAVPLDEALVLDDVSDTDALRAAHEVGKPVVVHTRAAEEETMRILAGFDGTTVLHCFSSPELLEIATSRGYYVSFAGNVTYPKAEDLREAARRVDRERILAETDTPYLAPQPVRGRPNEPAHVVHTVAALAAARGEDEQELGRRIAANAARAFSLP